MSEAELKALNRRQALALLGLAGTAVVAGACNSPTPTSPTATTPTTTTPPVS